VCRYINACTRQVEHSREGCPRGASPPSRSQFSRFAVFSLMELDLHPSCIFLALGVLLPPRVHIHEYARKKSCIVENQAK
jgi:hypothetical protein